MPLTDTQLIVLSAALARKNRSILPLPERIRGSAIAKVCGALIAKGLAAVVEAGPGDPIWRDGDMDRATMLIATDAAAEALGVVAEPTAWVGDGAAAAPQPETNAAALGNQESGTKEAKAGGASARTEPETIIPIESHRPGMEEPQDRGTVETKEESAQTSRPAARAMRSGTKQDVLIAMLRRPEGASLDEIAAAFGWQAHTVRGAIAGALKKRLGLTVASEKIEGRGRIYRILD